MTNCYIIADDTTKEAAVIDPGDYFEDIAEVINTNELTLKYIILTHSHFDHIGAVGALKEKTAALIIIHESENEFLKLPERNLSIYMKEPSIQPTADITVKGGEELSIGDIGLNIIHTPGHSMGGICILAEDKLFSGDTLFKGDIGRSDLIGGDYDVLINSINTKLMPLADNVSVYPGHGPSTTIGDERKNNRYIRV